MDLRYIQQILKPYVEFGIKYTDRYKSYGLEKAALLIDGDDIENLLHCKSEVTEVVAIDFADFSFLSKIKSIVKLCMIFTKKIKHAPDFKPIYESQIQILLLSDSRECIKEIDFSQIPQLTGLKTNAALFDINHKYEKLISISLSNIRKTWSFRYLSHFPRLNNLILENGKISDFDIDEVENDLCALTLVKMHIGEPTGLRKFYKLRYLSINGMFSGDLINELPYLKNLEYLNLDCNVEIENLDWVRYLPNLKVLILGCLIKTDDLSILKGIPFVRIKNDSLHYNLHDGDLRKEYPNELMEKFKFGEII